MGISCKHCGGTSFVKNGFVRNLQRYRCKKCGCNFTATPKRGCPTDIKALAIWLYRSGKISFRKVGSLLGVSAVSAYKWVHQEGGPARSEMMQVIREIELDDLHHLLGEKTARTAYGKPLLVMHGEVSPELWLAVIIVGDI
ncbi:MAG: hypothetical protein PHU44_00730 [Syntrophales bacterium]|nr:hypothetical protein [Syntrophales bacterium]